MSLKNISAAARNTYAFYSWLDQVIFKVPSTWVAL